jgi:septum site-determining protein MinC
MAQTGSIDFASLVTLLRSYRLCPIAVKGGTTGQMADALAAGLVAAHDTHLLGNKPQLADARENPAPAAQTAPSQQHQQQHAAPPAVAHGALVIDRPLRSGQQVYARGRDLVVMAMVNAGAEVIADGHIHVYAPLRGRAMAGARGNADARIFSLALDAELLSIAGVYRTSDKPLPASVLGQPTQVRLVSGTDGDKLVMEKMT